jgi:hypothetical protein
MQDLRKGLFDVLIGVNLLREGLDLPGILVAILDADKEFCHFYANLPTSLMPIVTAYTGRTGTLWQTCCCCSTLFMNRQIRLAECKPAALLRALLRF